MSICAHVQASTFSHHALTFGAEPGCSDYQDVVPFVIYINTTSTHVHLPSPVGKQCAWLHM